MKGSSTWQGQAPYLGQGSRCNQRRKSAVRRYQNDSQHDISRVIPPRKNTRLDHVGAWDYVFLLIPLFNKAKKA
jgi:hypothetical protein